jgi:hypothetical protein
MGEGVMLTIVMPYYDNASMLSLHYRTWKGWPGKIRKAVEVVIVDDGSPTSPASNVPRPYDLPAIRIYRVLEDKPWHQHGARNLGAHVAEDGWLLLTDMDHLLTAASAIALLKKIGRRELDKGTAYMLDRIEADTGLPTLGHDLNPKPHPNSFVITRSMFWRIGGYDEDLCGLYGTDRFFRERVFATAERGHLKIPLVRYWRDLIPDASTTTLPRKEGRDPGAKQAILVAKAARGEADVVKTLQFEWERVL